MFKLLLVLLCLGALPACDKIVADEMPGAATSGDLSAHLGGCDNFGRGLIKCAPNIGTQTASLSVYVSAPLKAQLQCSSYSCVRVEIRDGAQILSTKWIHPEQNQVGFSFYELLREEVFTSMQSALLGVKVTIYYKGEDKDLETVYDGEIRLKPVAAGYRPLAQGDRYTAARWNCFNGLFECGLSTRGRSYMVKK